jgi:arsenate reductase-like glutaredoxin family protein
VGLPAEWVDATKVKIGPDEALRLARTTQKIVAGRGKKVVTLAVDQASDEELLAVLLGPTGYLKAPTLRLGGTLLVGFVEPAYQELFAASTDAS